MADQTSTSAAEGIWHITAQPSIVHNRRVLGFATKMRKRVRHFDENSANPQLEGSSAATTDENLQQQQLACLRRRLLLLAQSIRRL
jgi:hypothetical protein